MKIEELINENYSRLNENDLYILKYILNNKKECCNLSINELASRCNISRTTILRLTHKLNFNGYSEFKVHLKWQEKKSSNITTNTLDKFYEDLNENIKITREKDFYKVCELIHNANRIFVHGTGTAQTTIARELKRVFLSVHKYLDIIEGATELEILKSNLNEGDVVIIISLSGNTAYLESFINELNIKGISCISITKMGNNMLSRKIANNLYVVTSSIDLGNDVLYETIGSFFIIIEVLIRKYINLFYTQEKNLIGLKEINSFGKEN